VQVREARACFRHQRNPRVVGSVLQRAPDRDGQRTFLLGGCRTRRGPMFDLGRSCNDELGKRCSESTVDLLTPLDLVAEVFRAKVASPKREPL
jgi:hypothetical protein